MERRNFVKVLGIAAWAVSTSGFTLIEGQGRVTTDCATSADILGPFYRKNAPRRTDLRYPGNTSELALKVIGKVYGSDCKTTLSGIEIDVWHCDAEEKYDMHSKAFRCRGKVNTDADGNYWFKTFIPPPYNSRPKHIHYLIHASESHQELVTQLYFKGDDRIKSDNWIQYPWDEKRILDVYKNDEGIAEVSLDLYLKEK